MSLAEGSYCKDKAWDQMDPRCARVILSGKIKAVSKICTFSFKRVNLILSTIFAHVSSVEERNQGTRGRQAVIFCSSPEIAAYAYW